MVAHIEISVVVMNDPRKDWILRQVILRPIGKPVDFIQVLNVWDLSIHPLARNFWQINMSKFFSLIPETPKNILPCSIVIEKEQHWIRVIIKPHLYTNVLETVAVSYHCLNLSICKLHWSLVRGIEVWLEFNSVFKEYKLTVLGAFNQDSTALEQRRSL